MDVRKLTPDLQKIAIKELNENPNRIQEDVNHLRKWLSKQPHIKARTDDQWLLGFLRGSKFSLEKAKEKLDMFYTMRTVVPEILKNRDPFRPELQNLLKLGVVLPLPEKNSKGEIVFLIRAGAYDPSKVQLVDLFKLETMIVDILMLESDNFMICGGVVISDMKDGTMAHYVTFTPTLLKKIMKIFQNAYPVRPKGLVYINAPSIFEVVLDLVRSFLTEKLRKRLKVFAGEKFEAEEVPVSVLPKEYGGNAGTIEEITAYWKKKIESYRDWFLDEDNYGTDEKKRPGKPKTTELVFGMEGSFRKLEVD